MFASRCFYHINPTLLVGVLLLAMHQGATAAITATGDVYPLDPNTAPTGSSIYVGDNGTGSLTIDAGSSLLNRRGTIGQSNGSHGIVTVTGNGSLWDIKDWLDVGSFGSGELIISGGGEVKVGQTTTVADWPPATGVIRFDQGTLTTTSLISDLADLTGTGTVNTHGMIADDIDLIFDATHGPTQTVLLDQLPGQNLTVNLSQDSTGILRAGYDGGGSITIRDGIKVNSVSGGIGYKPGSSGIATVSGVGSEWNITRSFSIPGGSSGELHIIDGGVVNVSLETHIGDKEGIGGSIYFDHGILNTRMLYVSADQLFGTGTIYTRSLVAEGGYDLIFDNEHGPNQIIRLNQIPGQDITIHLDYQGGGVIGAGYRGEGSFIIRDGMSIYSIGGYVGYLAGSNGTATVSGPGTFWDTNWLAVGVAGDGALTIRDSAMVLTENLAMKSLGDYYGNTSYINLANGGMLAIEGRANTSLMDYYGLIFYSLNGWSDTLRYWDVQQGRWAGLTHATLGEDYTLDYFDTGDLAGYTVLTVHTPLPEPHTAAVLWLGLTAFLHQRRGR